ncbi:hypothetical protein JCM16814_22990 [Desulfobaculum senezii]|jgi:predicted RNA-binding Zn-ribbon protein involved in translation (DUF1610 family)
MGIMSVLLQRYCPNCGEQTYQRYHCCLKERFTSRSYRVCEKCHAKIFEDGTCERPQEREMDLPTPW